MVGFLSAKTRFCHPKGFYRSKLQVVYKLPSSAMYNLTRLQLLTKYDISWNRQKACKHQNTAICYTLLTMSAMKQWLSGVILAALWML